MEVSPHGKQLSTSWIHSNSAQYKYIDYVTNTMKWSLQNIHSSRSCCFTILQKLQSKVLCISGVFVKLCVNFKKTTIEFLGKIFLSTELYSPYVYFIIPVYYLCCAFIYTKLFYNTSVS